MPGTVTIATNMAGRGTDIQLGGNDRYRARDWLKEEIDAGRMGAVHDAGDSPEALRQWVDDILNAGDEWIDARLKEWVDGQLAEWTKQQSGNGREPTAEGDRQEARGHRGRAPPGRGEARRDRQGVRQGPGAAGTTATMPTQLRGLVGCSACARKRASGSAAPMASGASAPSTRPCSAS